MRLRAWLAGLCVLPGLFLPLVSGDEKPANTRAPISWKKTVLDRAFRSEGVAVADVNKDGKLDILNGEVWYEAPTWKMHEIRPSKDYTRGKDNVYSNSFACWTEDLNGDGWVDLIVIGFPGAPCHWFENPQGKPGHWKQHEIWHSACNETPQYVDLLGTGKRVLVMGWQPKGQMAYFTPGKDPTQKWQMHPISEESVPPTFKLTASGLEGLKKDKVPAVLLDKLALLRDQSFASARELLDAAGKHLSKEQLKEHQKRIQARATVGGRQMPGTQRFDHGLGVGDVNGDGRLDVITNGGWWEQPARPDGKTPWKYHPGRISDPCADMYAVDIDGDGKADVLSSSAHNYGIWWARQTQGKDGKTSFVTRTLFPRLVSQTHAMVLADINGDGVKDFITGKRWWAHGPRGDADPNAPAMIYWFEARKGKDGMLQFTPRTIDDDSGIGTQFSVTDVNGDGLLDVVVSNKKGTFLIEQVRTKK